MMEPLSENTPAQDDHPAPVEVASLGRMLREARERIGLSVADVAGQTKLAVRQIEALEAEDFRHLPEMPFVRGFVRSYAKILQMDAQPLLACLPQSEANPVPLVPTSVEAPFPSALSPQKQNLIWLGAALLLSVMVVAFAVWHFTTPPGKAEVTQAEASASTSAKVAAPTMPMAEERPVESPAVVTAKSHEEPAQPLAHAAKHMSAEAESQVEPLKEAVKHKTIQAEAQAELPKDADQPRLPLQAALLRLKFSEESWVEVKDRDGKVLSSQVNPSGSELRLNGDAPFSMVIGHAASVRLYYRGKLVDLAPHINAENDVAKLTLE